ncbi:glucosamine-6-phosphate deaminase [Sporosarcina sp. PTS2304]|uniref:glucosamine-6-phosphate deaminase n=1 Tax=Sporosarcina sp. PTS2304 TaxID=2283194 RepID=UPI000E0D1987|nr:glucosamine-6-phosphate deaminase [Sporosarcina sp. PTS2304]AXH98376.1 glucosamine-6-phosphate deaminase [Sporosarcina sp. PTS2304]
MENVKWITVTSPEEGAKEVYKVIEEELQNNRLHVLGLATGSTMIPVYQEWIHSNLDFSEVTAFNLDEYVGIGADNPNSYAYFMKQHLFSKKPFKETHIPNGMAEDLDKECEEYEQQLNAHPLDIQLLGVGENGHIAFNEPGTSFDSVTHVATLTDSTLDVNSQYFENDEKIPNIALTMGISSINKAGKLIMVAFGEKKRAAMEKLKAGEVTAEWPITKLLLHNDVLVITDLQID